MSESLAVKRLTRKEKIAQGVEKLPGRKNARNAAARKEARKTAVTAELWNLPYPPRKVRILLDMVRGKRVENALALLKLSPRIAAEPVRKLLVSAVKNWEDKFGVSPDEGMLYVKTLTADGGPAIKRIRPAPQGRAHRIRKRFAHVKIELGHISELEGAAQA